MKERIKKFFAEDGGLLIGFWFNVAMMAGLAFKSIMESSWFGCVLSVFLYLPWALLFICGYKWTRMVREANDDISRLYKATSLIIEKLKRYEELHGELPEEKKE